jgi:hypothetical protein
MHRPCAAVRTHVYGGGYRWYTWDALSSLPSTASGVKLGCRACCGFASVHCLPRPTARSLPFSYGSTGDELAARTF